MVLQPLGGDLGIDPLPFQVLDVRFTVEAGIGDHLLDFFCHPRCRSIVLCLFDYRLDLFLVVRFVGDLGSDNYLVFVYRYFRSEALIPTLVLHLQNLRH